jgi:hypothetical protein
MTAVYLQIGLFAFAAACAFVGAALYVNFVEQPARLALDPQWMVREWVRSNRWGFVLLSALAVLSALLAYVDYALTRDARLIIGGTIILASWPYTYFVIIPVNVWLCTIPADAAPSAARELMRDWGLLEWGQTAIGLAACWMFAWASILPA